MSKDEVSLAEVQWELNETGGGIVYLCHALKGEIVHRQKIVFKSLNGLAPDIAEAIRKDGGREGSASMTPASPPGEAPAAPKPAG